MINSALKEVLGNNKRIRDFIIPYNPRKAYPSVDDKILTHQIAKDFNLPVPEVYFTIESVGELRDLSTKLEKLESFVVKPANGSKGNGILLISHIEFGPTLKETIVHTIRKKNLSYSQFRYYLSGILSGMYSLNGRPDKIIFQEKLNLHPDIKKIVPSGIPDIRVILFKGIPAMAMTRLPTIASGGRGNLHQGAVGCGIDLKSGKITNAILNNKVILVHPDTHERLVGLTLPNWREVLDLASKCSEAIEIGYLGVDIVLDPIKGPMLLEMNARPGLSIQLANMKGIMPLLNKIKEAPEIKDYKKRVDWSLGNL